MAVDRAHPGRVGQLQAAHRAGRQVLLCRAGEVAPITN